MIALVRFATERVCNAGIRCVLDAMFGNQRAVSAPCPVILLTPLLLRIQSCHSLEHSHFLSCAIQKPCPTYRKSRDETRASAPYHLPRKSLAILHRLYPILQEPVETHHVRMFQWATSTKRALASFDAPSPTSMRRWAGPGLYSQSRRRRFRCLQTGPLISKRPFGLS